MVSFDQTWGSQLPRVRSTTNFLAGVVDLSNHTIAHKFAREGARLVLGLPDYPVRHVAEAIDQRWLTFAEVYLGDLADEAQAQGVCRFCVTDVRIA